MARFKSKPDVSHIASSFQNIPQLTLSDINTQTRQLVNKFSSGKTILFFYMPSCTWCKEFKPTFEKVVSHFASNPNINFATIDITSPEGMSIQSYFNSLPHPKFLIRTVPKLVGFNNGKFHSLYAKNSDETFRTFPEVVMYVEGVGIAPVEEDKVASS